MLSGKRSQQILQQRHGQKDSRKTRRVWYLRSLEKKVFEEGKKVKSIKRRSQVGTEN